jgi:Ribonuclease G/E
VVQARLLTNGSSGRNAIAVDERGTEYLLPNGAAGATEGSMLNVAITREAIPGAEPWKRPLAKLTKADPYEGPRLTGRELPFPAPADELDEAGWNDLIEEARSSVVTFAGGELRIAPTAAMTLIDVDGYLPPEALAVLGAAEAAKAIRRLDIGGSIGIDLPTTGSKTVRKQAATAIDARLPQPFERTAVNGFGFVQIVRPRLRPSLVELAHDRPSFEARTLLRRAAFERPGPKRLVTNPAVIRALEGRNDWTEQLARQLGGPVELRGNAALPISGGYAESI